MKRFTSAESAMAAADAAWVKLTAAKASGHGVAAALAALKAADRAESSALKAQWAKTGFPPVLPRR